VYAVPLVPVIVVVGAALVVADDDADDVADDVAELDVPLVVLV